MKAEEYLSLNKTTIKEECQIILQNGSKAIITIKENGDDCVHKVSTIEQFTAQLPENKFFKQMRDGVTNAVKHRVIPIAIFESQKVRLISLPDDFPQQL